MVRREDARLEAVGARGGLGKRQDSSVRVSRPLESHGGGRCRYVMDVRDAPNPPHARAVRLVLGEVVRAAFHGVTGPSVVRLDAAGNVPGRS
jgi:hypothetical protein